MTAKQLTDAQLDQFLDLVRKGTPRWAAAKQLDSPTSITQIHRRAEKDREFAAKLGKAYDEGHISYKASIRAEAIRQAFAGDYSPGTIALPTTSSYREFWLLNVDTGDVYPLGPMYGGTVPYARRKLTAESLPYRWTLLAPVAESE